MGYVKIPTGLTDHTTILLLAIEPRWVLAKNSTRKFKLFVWVSLALP